MNLEEFKVEYCKWFDSQSVIVKILLLIPVWGWIFSGLYRIFKFIDNKNIITLIIGILCFVCVVGWIASIVDIITVALTGKISVLAD